MKHPPSFHTMKRTMIMKHTLTIILSSLLTAPLFSLHAADTPPKKKQETTRALSTLAPAYTIIDQLPPGKEGGYFMAPSMAKMPSGTLVAATCQGEKYPDGGKGLRSLSFYQSKDGGAAWKKVGKLPYDSCEPNLFVHEGRLYLLITPNGNNGRLERSHFPRDGRWGLWVSVSDDEGATWTPAKRVVEGKVRPDQASPQHNTGGQTAMVVRNGCIYLTVSDNFARLAAVACQFNRGIRNPDAWRISDMVEMPIPPELVHAPFQGRSGMRVLEGNVVNVAGRLLVVARAIINGGATANMGAVFEILDNAQQSLRLQFLQLYPIPGGQMKFYIQYDAPSQLYWMASNLPSNSAFLVTNDAWEKAKKTNPWATDRRSLTLWYSVDSLNWFPAGWVARAQCWTQSFHYPVMLIDGDDLLIISRTGLHSGNQHDVDAATFHRIKNFRNLAVDLTPTFPGVAK